MRRGGLLSVLLFCGGSLGAEETAVSSPTVNSFVYARPGLLTALQNQPGDQKEFWRSTFRRENVKSLGALTAGTGLLIALDQYLYERTRKIGDQLNIAHDGEQKTFLKTSVFHYTLRLNGPHDLGTALYFLGDGITHAAIAGSFLGTGLVRDDNRALQTSSQLAEGILANGVVVQVLKHVTGRENPNTTTRPGGRWRWFPNQKDYAKHVNKYDAFPSGHLSTAMVTVTVISANYPEHRWIKPVGYTLMGGLAFQMVNNGVHWVSDYPLALFLGYAFGHIAVRRGRTPQRETAWTVLPAPVGDGLGIQASLRFGSPETSPDSKRAKKHI